VVVSSIMYPRGQFLDVLRSLVWLQRQAQATNWGARRKVASNITCPEAIDSDAPTPSVAVTTCLLVTS